MGNRNGSRRKQRDPAYAYADNRRNEYASDKNGGSINRRSNPAPTSNYHQYANGYGGVNPIAQPANNYPKANLSKNFTSSFFIDHLFSFLKIK
jgi:hypothetical protein